MSEQREWLKTAYDEKRGYVENMTTITLAIKLTNYHTEMGKRGYTEDEMKQSLLGVWNVVTKKQVLTK